MKELPIGIQDFKEIIQKNYLYVDKTRPIYDLIKKGKLYFLSRPRRFGKTLVVSTLKYIFEGNKDLFQGLYIAEGTDYDWATSPVLVFNFAKLGHQVVGLEENLKQQLELYADEFGITLAEKNLASQLEYLVTKIKKKHGEVVFLVDEYDKPIIDFIDDEKLASFNQKILCNFFSPLKSLEAKGYLKFVLISGTTKFAPVSPSPILNNLMDLTDDRLSNDLLGITKNELLINFESQLMEASTHLKLPKTTLLEKLELWYGGYSWDGKTFVYHPVFLLSFFKNLNFQHFWTSPIPLDFLKKIAKRQPKSLQNKDTIEVTDVVFGSLHLERLDYFGLLFQLGFWTIKSTRNRNFSRLYTLGFPNQEIRGVFKQFM